MVALVQFNVDGASDNDNAFLQATTTTNVFADDETDRFVASRSVPVKAELFVSLSTRAIAALAGGVNRSKATLQSRGKTTRTKRGWFFINWPFISLALNFSS